MSTRVPSPTSASSHLIVIVPAKAGSSERKFTACTTRTPGWRVPDGQIREGIGREVEAKEVAMALGRFITRVTIGALFIGHGTQKLLGWFGGGGLDGTSQMFDSIGLRPARRHAVAAGAAEATGGSLLVLGLATPAAAAMLSGVMLTAIRKVHFKNGIWNTNGGYEYNSVLLAALFELVENGPGAWSLDEKLRLTRRGTKWSVAALGAGIAGAELAIRSSRWIEDTEASDEPMRAEADYQREQAEAGAQEAETESASRPT
jgi:putative oxidoreductase